MAVVHDQHTQINSPRGEVVLHQLSPTFFFRLGNLGKAITGQIHKIAGLVDGEIVDMDGLTGLIPYPGEILALQNPVDHRGLSHVGLARKGNLGQTRFGKIPGRGGGDQKFDVLKVHMPPLTGAAQACF